MYMYICTNKHYNDYSNVVLHWSQGVVYIINGGEGDPVTSGGTRRIGTLELILTMATDRRASIDVGGEVTFTRGRGTGGGRRGGGRRGGGERQVMKSSDMIMFD